MKYYGNRISKKLAIEIFGEKEIVAQAKTIDGKNAILVSCSVNELDKKNSIYSAKTHKYITDVFIEKITTLNKAKGIIYVAD